MVEPTKDNPSQTSSNLTDPPSTAQSDIQLILSKLSLLEGSIRILNNENLKRADEIKLLARETNALLTEDEGPSRETRTSTPDSEGEENKVFTRSPENSNLPSPRHQNTTVQRPVVTFLSTVAFPPPTQPGMQYTSVGQQRLSATLIPAKDLIRTIEVLNGRDDIGVRDFIKGVKRARNDCSEPDLLLRFVIAEKIIDHAKRAIRYANIKNYDDLYDALERNLAPVSSIELCRSRLENCRQNINTVQDYNIRFRQLLNELNYAIQGEYRRRSERNIAIKLEDQVAVKRYIMNLRDEISTQVQPLIPTSFVQAQQYALEAEAWHRERLRNKAVTTA